MVLFITWLSWPTFFTIIIFLVAAYFLYMCLPFFTFGNNHLPVVRPLYPIFGNLLPMLTEGFIQSRLHYLKTYGETYVFFSGRTPAIETIDFDIIREVFIKDNASFPNRFDLITGDKINDIMLNNNANPEHWKYLRSIMSPTFSSGKLRKMMPQINKCARQMLPHLIKMADENKSIEFKGCSGSYTMDVIASTAFGIELNTQEDQDNLFITHAKGALDIDFRHPMFLILFFFPFLKWTFPYFKFRLIKKTATDFFLKVTNQVLDARKEDSGKVDFIGLMMNSHKELSEEGKSSVRGLTREEIQSQAILFFVAAYDSTATTISFLGYNLALNQDRQDQLIEEVDRVFGKESDADTEDISDEQLNGMSYLEMCINESLRLFPPAAVIMRTAFRDVKIKGICLPKGTNVTVPVYDMHHHAGLYPEPEKYLPERFSPEEKAKREPLSFLPFGAGPRQCIASRLAMIEVKVAIVRILQKFRFVTAPETEVPITFTKMGLLNAEHGIWVKLEKRV